MDELRKDIEKCLGKLKHMEKRMDELERTVRALVARLDQMQSPIYPVLHHDM